MVFWKSAKKWYLEKKTANKEDGLYIHSKTKMPLAFANGTKINCFILNISDLSNVLVFNYLSDVIKINSEFL